MSMEELAKWLDERDHQVTLCLRKEDQGLYIKMIDMKTGMVQMGLLGSDLLEDFQLMIDRMYRELMDALGREEKNA